MNWSGGIRRWCTRRQDGKKDPHVAEDITQAVFLVRM